MKKTFESRQVQCSSLGRESRIYDRLEMQMIDLGSGF
jgi:hypothetical protein